MLEEAGAAAARGATVLAEIRGHGDAFDGSRGRDEDGRAAALARAVAEALERAGRRPADLVCASRRERLAARGPRRGPGPGDGARRGDGGAAGGGRQVDAGRGPGRLGGAPGGGRHPGDACRVLLPGTVGLEQPEEGLPLARIGTAGSAIGRGCALVTAPGLEGASCALVIEVA